MSENETNATGKKAYKNIKNSTTAHVCARLNGIFVRARARALELARTNRDSFDVRMILSVAVRGLVCSREIITSLVETEQYYEMKI